jgi:hypothetical protein
MLKGECSCVGILCVTFKQAFTPVNGTGVVFYVDNGGAIRGVLIWGIPGDEDVSGGGLEVSDRSDRIGDTTAEGLSLKGICDHHFAGD